ncbi:ABC transporter ATP-binding protein [Cellulomonas fimi]|uniref:ABC transporter related protein n=1 Tax=Cellulomonas fimi (strain ATCC 484 / DSM 20113 / JCM 1341 / CCUG 24087 / LMG 16345 / NBRC 15513 / NCIMB 8980 / NCTC 7547 / NRS-133) TaxID=590998 RepID=F4H5W9_CELFA|nr:ABC transporter ATP-binding protein [Cellulomonas fimi]AEE45569.1 ABC transporter related protein [Cellulomonas fimi ATCC 484]VEH29894.1 Aliphatic sulfonates import ATP-binding protein SsuB [Cellulomonas fimi]
MTGTPGQATVAGAGVRADGVRVRYGDRTVLDGVDLTVGRGELVALVGRSGSGKSTLLRVLAGLEEPAAGRVTLAGAAGVAFQEHRLLPWRRVAANVGLGLPRAGRTGAVRDALAAVGLADRADAWPTHLSGGQAQRVALARALVRRPPVLLLDEPFGALDALTRRHSQDLLVRLHARHGCATLLVTHDPAEAVRLAGRVLVLDAGRVVAEVAADGRDAHARVLDLLGVHPPAAIPGGAAHGSGGPGRVPAGPY